MIRKFTLFLALIIVLAACGGDTKKGVELEGASYRRPTATSAPPTQASETSNLTGRLLLRQGAQFVIYDLATGTSTPIEGLTNSSAALDRNHERGVFISFPEFGVIDLTSNTFAILDNRGSNPQGYGISPDGQWMAAATGGGYRTQIEIFNLNDLSSQVAATANVPFIPFTWTADNRLLWYTFPDINTLTLFDPVTGESTPAGSDSISMWFFPFSEASPDGMRLANVGFPFGPQGANMNGLSVTDPDATCFDSAVQLYSLPVTFDPAPQPEIVWTEPQLIASSPHWIDNDTLLFVVAGYGECGQLAGETQRQIMLLDVDAGTNPRPIAGPLGNADDPSDFEQAGGRTFAHLYSVSPDGQSIAWIGGGYQADETLINVTNIETGDTQTVLRYTRDDADDAIDYLGNYMFRQVAWLD